MATKKKNIKRVSISDLEVIKKLKFLSTIIESDLDEIAGIAIGEYWEKRKDDVLREIGVSPVADFIEKESKEEKDNTVYNLQTTESEET
jgi:hypothetical protein